MYTCILYLYLPSDFNRVAWCISYLRIFYLQPWYTTQHRPQYWELHAPLFANSVWFLLCPTGLWILKGSEMEPTTVYRPDTRRLETLTICRCHYKGSTFSWQLFKDPEYWSGWSRTHNLPNSSQMLNHYWANRSFYFFQQQQHLLYWYKNLENMTDTQVASA